MVPGGEVRMILVVVLQEACTAYIYNVDFLEMELTLYCILPAICPYMEVACEI